MSCVVRNSTVLALKIPLLLAMFFQAHLSPVLTGQRTQALQVGLSTAVVMKSAMTI